MSDENALKFVILGEGRVGKTSILSRYFNKKFDDSEQSTINPSFYKKKENFQGKNYDLNFWDTAGQEQFNAINTMYYTGAVGAILVYDVTIGETFEKVKNWVNTLKEAVGNDICFVIAGNKFDLTNKDMINKNNELVDAYCKQQYCKHFYTSAKSGYNVEEAFSDLIKTVLNKVCSSNSGSKNTRGRKLKINEDNKNKSKDKKGCC